MNRDITITRLVNVRMCNKNKRTIPLHVVFPSSSLPSVQSLIPLQAKFVDMH